MKRRFSLFVILFAWLCAAVQAKDLGDYHVGDIATVDITSPVPLDVEDAAATSALQSAQAQKYPSIFRGLSGITNDVMQSFLNAFSQARTRFQKQLTNEFTSVPLDDATIHSANFDNFVTAFGIENRNFPVTDKLAAEWARGNDGQFIQEKLLHTLLWVEDRHICPDVLPANMIVGKAVRLVPVTSLDDRLPLEIVQAAPVMPASSLITVSNAQAIFRREFPAEDQLLARAVAALIKPNCIPDPPFTQLTRGTAVCQLVVSDHFDAGDTIVHRGAVIDLKIKAALTALNEKLKSTPSASAAPPSVAATVIEPDPPPMPTPPASPLATSEPIATAVPEEPNTRHPQLILALTATSVIASVITALLFLNQRKRRLNFSVLPKESTYAELTTPGKEVTEILRESVQKELISQRRGLLIAQQAASEEINSLVHRLDELQAPMQERLQTYEARIRTLEKELAIRDEENRQLLKIKIEMITRQMETERGAPGTAPAR